MPVRIYRMAQGDSAYLVTRLLVSYALGVISGASDKLIVVYTVTGLIITHSCRSSTLHIKFLIVTGKRSDLCLWFRYFRACYLQGGRMHSVWHYWRCFMVHVCYLSLPLTILFSCLLGFCWAGCHCVVCVTGCLRSFYLTVAREGLLCDRYSWAGNHQQLDGNKLASNMQLC